MQDKMIFVVGNSRSGTTMLARILGGSKEVFMFRELHFFEQIWVPSLSASVIDGGVAVDYIARLMAIQRDGYYVRPDINKYRSEAQRLVDSNPGIWTAPRAYAVFVLEEARQHGKSIPCDQTPRNLFFLNEILTFYPHAYIVHIIRDPRDVLLSQKNRWRRRRFSLQDFPLKESIRSWASYHPISISLLWRSGIKAWERFKDHPRIFPLRFEDLLENPHDMIELVCHHVGIEYHSSMLDVPQIGSSHGRDKPDSLGINKNFAGRWQHAGRGDTVDLALCQAILKKMIREFGYEVGIFSPNPIKYLLIIAAWPIKALLAVIAYLDKSPNIIAYVYRRVSRLYG